ncbi:hypothetical protein WME79_48040 [Sorangium sp. So ce726]|uniref:hypothetical protein n=1 Tax=Sorangium sp. So ce726 TaxID=3133319 RepID=UPI003F63E0B2
MTFKEWNAAIMLTGQALITGWLVLDAVSTQGWDAPVSAVSGKMLWALLASVAFNIVATIVVTIVVSVVRREALKDERADERDDAIAARSMRNGYIVLSIGGGLILALLALGGPPALGAYALFAALMLGGAADSVSKLIYYRIG